MGPAESAEPLPRARRLPNRAMREVSRSPRRQTRRGPISHISAQCAQLTDRGCAKLSNAPSAYRHGDSNVRAVNRAGSWLLAAALLLGGAAPALAMPGDPPVVPLGPEDGATVPANPDGIQVRFACPTYRISGDGGRFTQFGDWDDYGAEFATKPDRDSTSETKTITVVAARGWMTSRRDDGAYRGSADGNALTLSVAGGGREIRRFQTHVQTLCVGPTPDQNHVISGLAPVKRAKVAPDGRFYALANVGRETIVELRGRLRGRRVTGGRVELTINGCNGSAAFSARRR
jgi:hypothetical protein